MTATKTKKKTTKTKPAGQRIKYSPAEQALREKYPTHQIKAGSYLWAGHPDNPFPGKVVISILCRCGAERQLATSDLHHVNGCKNCRDKEKKEQRKARRQEAKK